jgi:hypothetical protein
MGMFATHHYAPKDADALLCDHFDHAWVKGGVLYWARGESSAPIAGLIARVETDTEREERKRVTATRVAAIGVFALAAKKQHQDRDNGRARHD